MKKHTLFAVLVVAALALSACSTICRIPVVNQIPGVTCPSPAPSPGN